MNVFSLFHLPTSARRHGRGARPRGMALVIILILVALLTILVVAFFSRAITSQKVSISSASNIEVSLFSDGAVDTLLADLKQEIVDGSTASQPAAGEWLYLPSSPPKMLPARAGTADTLPNLVKRSAHAVAPYPGGVARAVDSSSLAASSNGRKMTPARWNKALLLPRDAVNASSATDFTPLGADAGNNAWDLAPDWVLVTRNGNNPTTWSNDLRDGLFANDNFVVGRYAYAVYDAGGLLDANAAGFPSGTPASATVGELAKLRYFKPNQAFADLRQLPGIRDLSTSSLQQQTLDLFTKVRNYTTWDATPAIFAENYYKAMQHTPKGFLTVANTALKNDRSDLLFSSRQDLLQFLLQGLPELGTFGAAEKEELRQKLPGAVQYLSHFTRALEQPSLAPETGRPKVAAGNGGNTGYDQDNRINPAFLNIRVSQAFQRNDDVTQAVPGEPLVQTRFALDRLAWITFKGPIANEAGDLSTDAEIQKIIEGLRNRGFSESFLKRGTPKNIYRYFGLSWVREKIADERQPQGRWVYSHKNSNDTGPFISLPPDQVTIKTLFEVVDREPDFVELLKATVNVGSLAKTAHQTSSVNHPAFYQYKRDRLADWAVYQLAANLIDQADLDGFPTRILLTDDVGELHEFRGVENLPYFFRTRVSAFQARAGVPTLNQGEKFTVPIKDTGVMVAMGTPELWNPHDQKSARCLQDGAGQPEDGLFPDEFRIVADTTDPLSITLGVQNQRQIIMAAETFWPFFPAHDAATPGTGGMPAASAPFYGDFTRKQTLWTADATALEFQIPGTEAGQSFFREPTVLLQQDVPAGSGLRPANANYLRSGTLEDGGRLQNLKADGLLNSNGTVLHQPNSERYLGMYIGSGPAQWVHRDSPNEARLWHHLGSGWSATRYATFRVQAKDPVTGDWATYDEKFVLAVPIEHMQGPSNAIAVTGTDASRHFAPLGGERASVAWDPRTSRFGAPSYNNDIVLFGPDSSQIKAAQFPMTWTGDGVLSSAGNVLMSNRPDLSSGFGAFNESRYNDEFWSQSLPNVGGWVPNPPPLMNQQLSASSTLWHFGMISQNSATFSGDGKRWSSDPAATLSSGAQYYADADGVVRRAMGAYVSGDLTGLPQATATTYGAGTPAPTAQSQSRPIVLNRPFRTVAELGHAFSGTPWKNVNFFTPESGDTGLLDVFCISEAPAEAVVAGKVNLNTRQFPVLQAILAAAYKSDLTLPADRISPDATGEAGKLAGKLVARTSGLTTNGETAPATGARPLRNVGELVGSWTSGTTYEGFSEDLSSAFTAVEDRAIQRRREAPIRALAASGQTRVWNLMIDIVAQTGRYPISASGFDQFLVDAEQRLWVHVAIDRLTGKIIDKQIEVVNE